MIGKSFRRATPLPTRSRRFCKALVQLILPLLFSNALLAQKTKPAAPNVDSITKKAEAAPSRQVLYNSGNHRDPFLNPLLLKKTGKQDEEVSRGLPPPGIAGTNISQAVLQGTAVRDDGRVAIVRGADNRAYFLKEGDRLFDGYLKSIDFNFITLVRETKLKSGKTLTQDVIKRLRTQ